MNFKNPSFQVNPKEPNWFSKMLLNIELQAEIIFKESERE
jgi:hypothetical protein